MIEYDPNLYDPEELTIIAMIRRNLYVNLRVAGLEYPQRPWTEEDFAKEWKIRFASQATSDAAIFRHRQNKRGQHGT